jgi:CubicO group peptidase (beta-lactamase class C family)
MKQLNPLFIVASLVFAGCNQSAPQVAVPEKDSGTAVPDFSIDTSLHFSEYTLTHVREYWNMLHQRQRYSGVTLMYRKDSFYIWYAGMADSTRQLKPDMPMQIASISKTICATAFMILRQQGKIRLTDTLGQFYPKIPYHNISMEHLLSHGSGLPEYVWLSDHFWHDSLGRLTNSGVITLLEANREKPYFKPGRRHFYCNTNYVLLASIIEKVSGLKYDSFLRKHIFNPLGMKSTRLMAENELVKDLGVKGHYGTGKTFEDHFQDGTYGDKNIVSTVYDLFRFYRGLRSNKLFPESVKQEMFKTRFTRARGDTEYALGWRKRDGSDLHWLFHTGWWHGFRSNFYIQPDEDICIVTLSNRLSGGFIPGRVITSMCFADRMNAILHPKQVWKAEVE